LTTVRSVIKDCVTVVTIKCMLRLYIIHLFYNQGMLTITHISHIYGPLFQGSINPLPPSDAVRKQKKYLEDLFSSALSQL